MSAIQAARPPVVVTIASVALGAYAVLISLTTWFALQALGVRDPEAMGRAFAKPIVIVIGVTVTIVGLQRLKNWAWWVAVLMGSAWMVGGILTLVEASGRQMATSLVACLTGATSALATAVLSLLTVEARRAFPSAAA